MLGRKYFTLYFLCFFQLSGIYAQQPRDITAYRLADNEQISLDGRLDESFWTKVNAATAFRQQEPLEGQLATEQTSVQIAFDEKNLCAVGRKSKRRIAFGDEIKVTVKQTDLLNRTIDLTLAK